MLDPRLFDLLETLAAADLDWLAEEVIQGVLAGDLPLESEASVIAARRDVYRKRQDSGGFGNLDVQWTEAVSLEGDRQLDWAVKHVVSRLDDALSLMQASTGRLDALVDGADSDGQRMKAVDAVGVQLVLTNSEEVLGETSRNAIEAAMTMMPLLKQALEEWRGISIAGGEA